MSSASQGGAADVEDPIVRVEGVARHFGDTDILRSVDLTVHPGEMLVIEGPSGSGKSTLLHLLAALERPDAGRIRVAGVEVTDHRHMTEYRRKRIGLVFQLHNLIPSLTARQNVEVSMYGTDRGRGERSARADELLDFVGLSDRKDSHPPTMSGGERQRVAIARALANNPPILLADEPTGSLDDDSAAQIIELFQRLRSEEGVTVLAVSHDDRLNRAADRVLRLRDGELTPR